MDGIPPSSLRTDDGGISPRGIAISGRRLSDIVAQARVGNGDWLEQATGRLSALVSLRRTDGASGNPVEDAVAGIEQDLANRDVSAAAKTGAALADTLDGEAKAMLEPWLLDAKARASAERALDAMHAAALAGLEK